MLRRTHLPGAAAAVYIISRPRRSERNMIPLLQFIHYLIDLYLWVVIAAVVFSWLISFNVINAYNPFVRSLWSALQAVTEPVLNPIRRMLPNLGGLDVSPIVLYLGLIFVQFVVIQGWMIPLFRTL